MDEEQPAPAPVVCTLRPQEEASRRELWEEIASLALLGRETTERGACLRFRALPGVEERLHEFAELESECCAFATFSVRSARDEVLLEVESSGEGVEAVRRMFEVR